MGEDERKVLGDALRRWEDTVLRAALETLPERRKEFLTTSSRPVRRLYTPLDLAGKTDAERLGLPGEFPYTRGIHPTMYRGRLWTMRLFAGFGGAEDTNRRFKYLFRHGETGLSVAFDMPTLYGYDTDAPEAKGEFGTCGVAVSSLEDMKILFSGIDLGQVSTSMTINAPASAIWAMYLAAAEAQGVPLAGLRGTLQNDILKEYQAQKEWIFPPEPSMRLVVDTFQFGTKQVPLWNTISISGYHIREAGATAGQELAFTLANGMEYVRWGIDRGLKVDDFANRLSFFFNAHNDLFEEIAKYRAARRIWAREMRDTFGAKNPRTWLLRFHAQTAGVSLTAQQPEINIIRTTVQALAAVLGGAQSLHTNSYDEAFQVPNEAAARLALRTQQILAHESGVANTVDPLGGSYFLEALTDELEEEAYRYFDRIQGLGGVIPAIRKGFFQQEIANSAYRYQREIEDKERVIVGVNDFAVDEQPDFEQFRVPEASLKAQLERLRRLRRTRDKTKHAAALDRLRNACESDENTMPFLLDAVRAKATLGEICNVMREVFGVYEEPLLY
ncbi:MAG TPA: methylmalonyl-CoA mutase family protein [Thermoplasmata archaeon]|nr:methylmalonyl-CoA mutase family protein [Thermoplasmata archaeon]